MPNVRAYRSGKWSDSDLTTSPWASGGVLFKPTANDYVFANGHRIEIDENVKVISVSINTDTRTWTDKGTGAATGGGYYYLGNNVVFEGIVLGRVNGAATTTMYLSGNNNATIVGTLSGAFGVNYPAIALSTTRDAEGTLNIIGNLYGGFALSDGNYAGQALYIEGNGIKVNISGFCYGLDNSTAFPEQYATIRNATSFSTIYFNGNMYAGLACPAFYNTTYTKCYFTGNFYATSGYNAIQNTSYTAEINLAGNLVSGGFYTAIRSPRYFMYPQPKNSYISIYQSGTSNNYFFTSDSLSGFYMPPISSVRLGTIYGNGILTGTCVVPSVSSVSFGVPFDGKVGISLLNPFDFFSTNVLSLTASNTIGEKLTKLTPIQSMGSVLASFSV